MNQQPNPVPTTHHGPPPYPAHGYSTWDAHVVAINAASQSWTGDATEIWSVIDRIHNLVKEAGNSPLSAAHERLSQSLVSICNDLRRQCRFPYPRAHLLIQHAQALLLVANPDVTEAEQLLQEARLAMQQMLPSIEAIGWRHPGAITLEVRDDIQRVANMLQRMAAREVPAPAPAGNGGETISLISDDEGSEAQG